MQSIDHILLHLVDPSTQWKLHLLEAWPTIMGNIAQHAHIEKILSHQLIIGVYDSGWLQELYYLSNSILEKVNLHTHPHVFRSLKFIKAVKHSVKRINIINHSLQPHKEITLTSKQRTALAHLHDQELAQALYKFLNRCNQE